MFPGTYYLITALQAVLGGQSETVGGLGQRSASGRHRQQAQLQLPAGGLSEQEVAPGEGKRSDPQHLQVRIR